MSWQPINTPPAEPQNVLLIVAPFEWIDSNGHAVMPEPMRDDLERMELGFWDGEHWCEAGTGHEIERDFRPDHLFPTHWFPLPSPPAA